MTRSKIQIKDYTQRVLAPPSEGLGRLKTLKAQGNILADSHYQVELLDTGNHNAFRLVPFQQKLEEANLFPLQPTNIEIFQVNIGKMCNQVCKHCHVDAGPDRKEIM